MVLHIRKCRGGDFRIASYKEKTHSGCLVLSAVPEFSNFMAVSGLRLSWGEASEGTTGAPTGETADAGRTHPRASAALRSATALGHD